MNESGWDESGVHESSFTEGKLLKSDLHPVSNLSDISHS